MRELQERIRRWSFANFGYQKSELTGQLMGSNNPFLGIIEEYGELKEAATLEEQEDAVADMLIYLCDFAARENIELALVNTYSQSVSVCLGHIARIILKGHQGIRGYSCKKRYMHDLRIATCQLFSCLNQYSVMRFDKTAEGLSVQVFEAIVAKRDWSENPDYGIVSE